MGEEHTQLEHVDDADAMRRERDALKRRVEELEAHEVAQAAVLAAGERRFRAIFDYAPVGIATFDLTGRVIDSNVALQRMLGYSADALCGKTYVELTHAEDQPRNTRLFNEVLTGERDQFRLEKRFVKQDGSILWGHVTASLVRSVTGQPEFAIVSMIEDITAQKAAESALAEVRADFQRMVENFPDGLAVHDGKTMLYINPAGARLLGVESPTAIIGRPVFDFVHPSSERSAHERISALIEGAERVPLIEENLLRVDGTLLEAEVAGTHVTYEGKPCSLVLFRDISQRKQAQAILAAQAEELKRLNIALQQRNEAVEAEIAKRTAELTESERKFRMVFEHARIGIILATKKARLLAANPAACEMLGFDEPEILRRGIEGITYPEDLARDMALVQELIAGRRDSYTLDKRYVRGDGTLIWAHLRASIIRDDTGKPAFGIALIENITERKQLEESLRAQNERLQTLDRLKTDFVNAVSHELRTPLTSIVGYAEFLEDQVAGELSPDQLEYVRQIQEGTHRLQRLVDDLLDFARLEAGTFALTLREETLAVRIREAVDSLRPQATAKRLGLVVRLPDEPLTLTMDGGRIGQVLINLLGNAIKFTPAGGQIDVSASRRPDEIRVEVRDNGIGIAPEHQSRLFDKFFQVDPTLTRASGGAGLGLSISKAIVEAHGGQIGVESAPGAGSTFWFTLPTHTPNHEDAPGH